MPVSWSFSTEPAFQRELDWVEQFVTEQIEPLDQVVGHAFDMADPVRQRLIPPLQQRVRDRGLWACHLGPELGGPGFGQVKLALLNEILGRTHCGPIVFGCQAPDSGNAEILARYGTPELRRRFLDGVEGEVRVDLVQPGRRLDVEMLVVVSDAEIGWRDLVAGAQRETAVLESRGRA